MFVSPKTIVLVGIYNQQFQGTIILMVFDFQGMDGTGSNFSANFFHFALPFFGPIFKRGGKTCRFFLLWGGYLAKDLS